MLLSVDWLKELTPYEGTIDTLCDRLTMRGLEIEEVRKPFEGLDRVVVGHVVACGRHPQADKLSVCRVDVGTEILDIVCGAPNVAAGQNVAVALVGAKLPNGMEIKKTKLRGSPSHGMICSERELTLSEDHGGIMVLDESLAVGTPIVETLRLDSVVLGVNVTPNRGDCLSILGLAREVAADFGLPLTLPDASYPEEGPEASGLVRIQIDDGDLCPVYRGRIIKGCKIGQSPAWMRYRLTAMGQRPISNLVDVTNYVMLELGQPLHAFDLNLIQGGMIRVARAEQGMIFQTLDGQNRTLEANDLLIWDGVRPVALAGVMGGRNSEITEASTDVLLECAVFKPSSIRKTARRLALGSEASYRFERGVDQPGSAYAMQRAASLLARLSGGTLLPGVTMHEPKPWQERTLRFRPAFARKLLGLPLATEFSRNTLASLGCRLEETTPEEWKVTPPGPRNDLEREVDLVEEVGRVYGLDRIPSIVPRACKTLETVNAEDPRYGFRLRVKHWGRGLGLTETVNYSFVSHKELDALGLPSDNRISVHNPLSEEQNAMRTSLAASLLQNVRKNISQGVTALRLFEVSVIFEVDPASETTAREKARLGLCLYGGLAPENWPCTKGEADYAELKGVIENLLATFRLAKARFSLEEAHPYLTPAVRVEIDGRYLGCAGRVRPDLADAHHARRDVWLAELDLDLIQELALGRIPAFRELPRFPASRRDMTLVAGAQVRLDDILDAVAERRSKLLEDVVLVDVFKPEGAEESNLTLRYTYRHKERTLKDEDVDKEHHAIYETLRSKLQVRLQ